MKGIQQLLDVMQSLRDPEQGCPWDRQQDWKSLIPYTLEEAYEVADAIERDDSQDVKSELGDLLFQVVFYAQIAHEQNLFAFDDVAQAISDKLIRRHPHVFAGVNVADAESQTRAWEQHKQREREAKANKDGQQPSHLDDVSRSLPAIMRAEKLQRRAARVGFDWPDEQGVLDKVVEELDELKQALQKPDAPQHIHEEMGDLLFTCVNLARHLGVNAEMSLRDANHKFEQRFRSMEQLLLEQGTAIEQADPDRMEAAWNQVKLKS